MKEITPTDLQTVGDYIDAYIIDMKNRLAHSTVNSDLSRTNKIKEVLGELRIDWINHTHINQLLAGWHERLCNKTINEYLKILRAVFKMALRDGVITRNPMEGVRNFKTVDPEPNPFTKKEIALMYECKTAQINEKNGVLFNVLTGLRISELLAAAWQDVDWKRKVLYVRRACVLGIYKCPKTKGSVREVDLNPLALDLLKAQLKLTGKRRLQSINILQCDNKTFTEESVSFIFVNTKTNQPITDAKELGFKYEVRHL